MEAKQIIVIRKDLNMRKGKMIAQGAHASMGAILGQMQKSEDQWVLKLDNPAVKAWLEGRFKKIAVSVNSEEQLLSLKKQAEERGLINCLITDSGLTEFGGIPTLTALSIGPAMEEDFKGLTDHLPLL